MGVTLLIFLFAQYQDAPTSMSNVAEIAEVREQS